MKRMFFIFLLSNFTTLDVFPGWKEDIKIDKESENRQEMIDLLVFYNSYTKNLFTSFSVGSEDRPVLTYLALKISDIYWENEKDCYFREENQKPVFKDYEYGAYAYKFSNGETGGMIYGDKENWKDWGSPCKMPPEEIFKRPKIKKWNF